MTEPALHGLLTLVSSVCTTIVSVITIAVVVPRRRQHRSVRVPLTVGLVIGGIGFGVAITNLVLTLNS